MSLLLGADIGTSACKIAAFETDGTVRASVTCEYPLYYPHPGWVEQNPDDWWDAVCRGIKELITKNDIDVKDIAGIGIDGQSWAAVAVDAGGNVLAPNPIWMDTRSEDICSELNSNIGIDRLFSLTGNPLKAQYSTGKVIWYKRQMPEVYEKTDKILQSNSFIVMRLTGVMTQEPSQGYGLHCFDMKNCCWDDTMCTELGIRRSLLPEIIPCDGIAGTVTKEAAAQTGLIEGIPVVAGGLDAACGTLGVGVIETGQTQEQGGQAGGMSICIDEYCADPRLILGFHVVPGKWLLQGGTTGGGGAMRWFDAQFGYEEREKVRKSGGSSLAYLDKLAATVPSGSDGVVFLPYMAGERSPIWDAHAKGVYYGLDFSKTRAHMTRATMEGVAYALRHNVEVAEAAGAKVGIMRSMGGAANSLFWTQMKCDVVGRKIEVPSSDTATTWGAAMLAGVGVGVFGSFDEAVEKSVKVRHEYEPTLDQNYEKGYDTYLKLYPALKNIMDGRSIR